VLSAGRIIERGRHAELLAHRALYYRLATAYGAAQEATS